MALTEKLDTAAYVGRIIEVGARSFTVDEEMAGHVQTYIDTVRVLAGADPMFVEQTVDFSHVIGEKDSTGTADTIILKLAGAELQVHDLKYGRGVKVDADENPQLMLYALGALFEYEMFADFKTVRMFIHQPRLNHISEYVLPVEGLTEFGLTAADRVETCRIAEEHKVNWINGPDYSYLQPGEKQCRFCKAKATCPALRDQVMTTVADDFVDLTRAVRPQLAAAEERITTSPSDHLADCLAAVDLIESWCKAVRGEAERRLFEGQEVPGFKLVEGRRGGRKWSDAEEAETALKAMRLKVEEMFDLTLISPTTAEKLHKAGKIGPRQWPKLKDLITQSEGKPSVAPADDKRPALEVAPSTADFDLIGA